MRTPADGSARPRETRSVTRLVVAIAVACVVALAHVHVRLAVLQAGYDLSRETRAGKALRDQNQKLRLELETRRDPQRIERRAREELGMAPPDPSTLRVLAVRPNAPAPTATTTTGGAR